MLSKVFATLIVDQLTPRGETQGICDAWSEQTYNRYGLRRAKDMWGAFNLLKAQPDIDAKHIFVEGFDYGGKSALFATANPGVGALEVKPTGVVAFDPYCGFGYFWVPTLFLVGEKGGVYNTALCHARSGKPNLDMVIYPNATHGFAWPRVDATVRGAHMVHDPKAAEDAQARATSSSPRT